MLSNSNYYYICKRCSVLSSIEDQSIDEDNDLVISLSANDVDGDVLTYSASVDGNSTFNVDGNILTVSPDADYNGSIVVDVLVTDGDLTDSLSFTLVVNPVNDAPILSVIEDQSIDEDSDLTLQLLATDIDTEDLTYSASIDGNGSVSVVSDVLTVTPNLNYNGDIEVSVTVSDGQYIDTQSFTLSIQPINDAPVLSSIEDQSINEDNDLVITLSANDVDGDGLTYSASVDGNSTSSVDGNILTISPDADYNGSIAVDVLVTDGDLTDSLSFTLVVNPVNDAPILSVIEDQSIDENNNLILELDANDIDQDALVFSVTVDDNATVSIEDNILTIVPDIYFNGEILINVYVTDGEFFDSQTFILTVNPINDPPILNIIDNQIINEDTNLELALVANDADGDILTYSASVDGNSTASVDGNILTVSPDADYNGSIVVDILVTDGILTDSLSFTLVVNPVNDAPILSVIEDQSIDEDSDLTLQLLATDIDTEDLTYSASIDGNGSVSVVSDVLTVTPNLNYNGDIEVSVTVSDGQYIDTQSFTLSIQSINDAPVLSFIENQSIDEDNDLVISLSASDVDGDVLEYFSVIVGDASANIVDNILTVTPDLNAFGDVTVTVAATDGNLTDTQILF